MQDLLWFAGHVSFSNLWVVRAVTNTSPADRGRKLLEKCVLFSSLDEKARRDIAAYARPRSFATGLKNAIHVGHSTGGGEVVHCIARHGESRGTKGFQAIPEPFPKIKRSERQGQSEPAGKKPIARHCDCSDECSEVMTTSIPRYYRA
jgi:hypothetical protein